MVSDERALITNKYIVYVGVSSHSTVTLVQPLKQIKRTEQIWSESSTHHSDQDEKNVRGLWWRRTTKWEQKVLFTCGLFEFYTVCRCHSRFDSMVLRFLSMRFARHCMFYRFVCLFWATHTNTLGHICSMDNLTQ